MCCKQISFLQNAKGHSWTTYGDGLETRVEDTTVEEGCTGVADDDGLSDEDDDGGEGGDEDVDFDVGVGVGVG